MEEGGGLFNLLPLDAIQCILSHLSPWDLICVAPHVCRTWAQVCRRAQLRNLWPSYVQRRMAWLVWRNVLQEGPYSALMRMMLPAPCMRRGYDRIISRFICDKSVTCFYNVFMTVFPNMSLDAWDVKRIRAAKEFSSCRREGGHVELNAIICMWYYLLEEIDSRFWIDCVSLWQRNHNGHVDTEPNLVPLYKIYRRLILVLQRDFGIPIGDDFAPNVMDEIQNGPEREEKRQKLREERNKRLE